MKEEMKMKKVISLLLALVMSVGMLAGCGGNAGIPKDATLKIGIPQSSNISSYEDNGFTKYLEEKTGVKIEFVYFASAAEEYKKQLALTCGAQEELPDILLGFDIGHYMINQYGEDGYFVDLTEYIDKYGENYKKAMETLDDEIKDYVKEKSVNTNDGAIYGLPRVICTASDDIQSMTYINKGWLDKLGLQIPTTIDELRNVLQAFKTQDPNGNGKQDEIPMIGAGGIQYYIINAFMHFDSGRFNVTDGKVWDPATTDEFRQALIYGNKLVKDELYSSLSFTVKTTTEIKNLISPQGEPSKVGIFCGLPSSYTSVDSDVLKDFVALPALGDATGQGGYTVVGERKISWTGFITKDCEYPELAMKFMDTFYTDDTISAQRHGVEGVDWTRKEGKNYIGTDSYVNVVNSEAFFSGNSTWAINVLGIMSHWNYMVVSQEGTEGRASDVGRLGRETMEIQETGKKPEERCIYLVYTTEEYEKQEEISGEVNTYVSESITEFFAGVKDPSNDATWDEFLTNLKSVGREDMLKIAQDAYSRK